MKKTILVTIVAGCMILFSTGLFAQVPAAQAVTATQAGPDKAGRKPKLTDDQKVAKELAKMDAIVHLTPDQAPKVKQLLTSLMAQREQNKATANGDKEKQKELNKGIGKQRNAGLKAILTKEQMTALKAVKNEKESEKMENNK